jgi:hypothetical protein
MVEPEVKSPPDTEASTGNRTVQSAVTLLRGLAGALAGVVVAYFLVKWCRGQGMYAMMLPGLLAGLGCGYASGRKSYWLGAIAAVVALVAGVLTEWHVFYNEPLGRFLSLLHTLKPYKHLMHLIGVAAAFWFGMGREKP